MGNKFQKIRVNDTELELLRKVSAVVVTPRDRDPSQRHDTSDVSPMVRLIGQGKVIPVRMPEDTEGVLSTLFSIFLDRDMSDPVEAPVVLNEFLEKLIEQKLRIIV